jgi:trimeric autotransporter adhesin
MSTIIPAKGNWSPRFGQPPNGLGLNRHVNALIIRGNDLVVGGAFTQAGSKECKYIARFDGSEWYPLGEGLPCGVSSMALRGTSLICSCWNGELVLRDEQLVTDETAFLMIYANGLWRQVLKYSGKPIRKLQLFNDLVVIVGSNLSLLSETDASSCLWLWPDGEMPHPAGKIDGRVEDTTIWNSFLVATGEFTLPGHETPASVALWDGDSWCVLPWPYDSIPGAATQHKGNLVVAGPSTISQELGWGHTPVLAQWDGYVWKEIPFISHQTYPYPTVDTVVSDGENLILGGNLFVPGTNEINNIAQWNGSNWESFENGLIIGWSGFGWVCAILPTEQGFYAGGSFSTAVIADETIDCGNIAYWKRHA